MSVAVSTAVTEELCEQRRLAFTHLSPDGPTGPSLELPTRPGLPRGRQAPRHGPAPAVFLDETEHSDLEPELPHRTPVLQVAAKASEPQSQPDVILTLILRGQDHPRTAGETSLH